MNAENIDPVRKVLNKSFLRLKPVRIDFEKFITELYILLSRTTLAEQQNQFEEHHKNHIRDFLIGTQFPKTNFLINTDNRKDMVIYNGSDSTSPIGVILECKRANNKTEMPTKDNINCKAMQELLWYYLQQRFEIKRNSLQDANIELKHLIITDCYHWYIFDAADFERYFAQDKSLCQSYIQFSQGGILSAQTKDFYTHIAQPFITKAIENGLPYVYFDLRTYESLVNSAKKKAKGKQENQTQETTENNYSEEELIKLLPLYKFFSPEHLLKQSFANDNNSLNQEFYQELLYLMGLEEKQQASNGGRLIGRVQSKRRQPATLLESTMDYLQAKDCLSGIVDISYYGAPEDRLFNVALELVLTWVNRLLFLKLLEGQLRQQYLGQNIAFLSPEIITNYTVLDQLFFDILAIPKEQRSESIKQSLDILASNVPYLNSSLFEISPLEHQTHCYIRNLNDHLTLPYYKETIFRDYKDKRLSKSAVSKDTTLNYLLRFLDAYDFASEGGEAIQEQRKNLINAAVLGLVFEKINGYRDGSFFTPGFITMYICRQTLRQAVLDKFNEINGWTCQKLDDLYNKIREPKSGNKMITQANNIINSLKICDPAVGSGHFLVSVLNELIAIKSELGILQDSTGKLLHFDYDIRVENDELQILDANGKLFLYKPNNTQSQRVQETLFHEKQYLIEHCLFGVDLNANSVHICRLRLWIELLKHSYYHQKTKELETLPNIDINIQVGNSLLSRYEMEGDIGVILQKYNWTVEQYRKQIYRYHKAKSREDKQTIRQQLDQIRGNIGQAIEADNIKLHELNKLQGELAQLQAKELEIDKGNQSKSPKKNPKIEKLQQQITKLAKVLEQIKTGQLYHHAIEWRYLFPEILQEEDAEFRGFDVVIGNPPYIQLQSMAGQLDCLQQRYSTFEKTGDIYCLFYELAAKICKAKGLVSFITSKAWIRTNYGKTLRRYLTTNVEVQQFLDLADNNVFSSATVGSSIVHYKNQKPSDNHTIAAVRFTRQQKDYLKNLHESFAANQKQVKISGTAPWIIADSMMSQIQEKVRSQGVVLKDWDIEIFRGVVTGYDKAFVIDKNQRKELIAQDANSEGLIKPLLRGRDVKRYTVNYQNLYLIATFPSLGLDIKKYPAIEQHLKSFGERLEQNGKYGCRKETNHKWFETQDSIAYHHNFTQPKIIYPNMVSEPRFTIDKMGFYYANPRCFILTGANLYSLCGILNSKLFRYCFTDLFPELQGSSREIHKIIVETVPIIPVYKAKEKQFQTLVDKIIANKESKIDTIDLENQVDSLVYQLYHLTDKEIQTIEDKFNI